jgi:hypothetical protein
LPCKNSIHNNSKRDYGAEHGEDQFAPLHCPVPINRTSAEGELAS